MLEYIVFCLCPIFLLMLHFVYLFIFIDNQINIIDENSKEKYKLFMMMNNRKRIKQTTKKREIRKLI